MSRGLQRLVASVVEKQKGRRWPHCKGPSAETGKNKVKEESRSRLLDFSPNLQLTTKRLAGFAAGRWAGVRLERSLQACGQRIISDLSWQLWTL